MKITQGIYEHYKSTKEDPKYYQVLFLSHFEETHETLVHYAPLYWDDPKSDVYDDGITVWTRTLTNFCENFEWNGRTVPRFTKIK